MTTAITDIRAALKAKFPNAASIIDKSGSLERLLNSHYVKQALSHAHRGNLWYQCDENALTPGPTNYIGNSRPYPPTVSAIKALNDLQQPFTLNCDRSPDQAERLIPGLPAYAGADGRSVKIGDKLEHLEPMPDYTPIDPDIQDFLKQHPEVDFQNAGHSLAFLVHKKDPSRNATAQFIDKLAKKLGPDFTTQPHTRGFNIKPNDYATKLNAHHHLENSLELHDYFPLFISLGDNSKPLHRHIMETGFSFKISTQTAQGPKPEYVDDIFNGHEEVALFLMLCAQAATT